MKSIGLITLSLLLFNSISCRTSVNDMDRDIKFMNVNIRLASVDESKNLLGSSDEFSRSQGIFDFASKTQNVDSDKESDYLKYASQQALEWTNKEADKTKKIIEEAEEKIVELGLKFELPEVINLVKSTCKEEGGAAGYTRQNYIVVQGDPDLHLFLHELFHVISRHNPELRTALYNTIHFEKCNPVELPEKLKEIKITNPDAPSFEHFVEVNVNGALRKVIILTLSNRSYDGGSFFQYLDLKLLELNEQNEALVIDGEPVLYDFADASDMLDKIGRNTNYNIHPEEVIAEHFTYLVNNTDVPEMEYIDEMLSIFRK